ncbi:response regulator [Alteromonas oceani]|uniref:Response regulator n=2 Tax=Alteromonas oceani TaxID=2071609 RepID=A0ABV7JZV5_9ALTE
MRGSLKVDSEPGIGTTITVELPLVKLAITGQSHRQEVKLDVPLFTGKTILVAEDNDINRMVVEELLKPTNAILVLVTDGAQVLDFCRDSYADIVLTDINMPVMGGEESLKKLRASGFRKPVVALTANAATQQVEQYLSLGFDDVLSKPVYAESLYRTLRKHLI